MIQRKRHDSTAPGIEFAWRARNVCDLRPEALRVHADEINVLTLPLRTGSFDRVKPRYRLVGELRLSAPGCAPPSATVRRDRRTPDVDSKPLDSLRFARCLSFRPTSLVSRDVFRFDRRRIFPVLDRVCSVASSSRQRRAHRFG